MLEVSIEAQTGLVAMRREHVTRRTPGADGSGAHHLRLVALGRGGVVGVVLDAPRPGDRELPLPEGVRLLLAEPVARALDGCRLELEAGQLRLRAAAVTARRRNARPEQAEERPALGLGLGMAGSPAR